MAKVCCTTDLVEYPATFLTTMFLNFDAFKSTLFIPVAAMQMSLSLGACSIMFAVMTALLVMIISAISMRPTVSSSHVLS